jgi:glycosyltransferase involved in cell wall biosynthesis
MTQPAGTASAPELSLVMPCYNEQDAVGYTIPDLVRAFRGKGHRLELIAVDNGSTDATGDRLAALAAEFAEVVPIRVPVNRGYGNGILVGFGACKAPWVGSIVADGQVDAEDVVRLFEAVRPTQGRALGKVRRRFRMDGVARKVVSSFYNFFVRLLWPRLGSIDINGSPKLFSREALDAMQLGSTGWLLDPEIMVKAHELGLRVIELNVFARMRSTGLSHVRAATCWEFFHHLLAARLRGAWKPGHRLPSTPVEQEVPGI